MAWNGTTMMYSDTGVIPEGGYISGAAITQGYLVFKSANGFAYSVAAGTDILTNNVGTGILGVALNSVTAANLPVRVGMVSENVGLVLPATGSAPTMAILGANASYALNFTTAGATPASRLCANLSVTTNGCARFVNIDMDSGAPYITSITSGIGYKTSGYAVGDLVRVKIIASARAN